ncbi:hypothetical protein E1263_20065 [Kribbella antibiotica]|uniref:Uncharacterized protein n=1 Tax=Kribbella antibiotica TaxID=190195 RepID=A0A4R4ZID3_9ACTN|nr:hypothetical protein [Kribbella antibiotica]TDD58215.1 hypothetical protein E1263_20065 [Kribbella antibiotica]
MTELTSGAGFLGLHAGIDRVVRLKPVTGGTGMSEPPSLTEREIRIYVERCPEPQQPAFEGWLRGTHHLDGELIAAEVPPRDGSQQKRDRTI